MMENELYFSEKFTKSAAWIDLLLLARHSSGTKFIHGIEIKMQPGDLCYSQLSLGERWKWNFKTVKKFLDLLTDRQMITYKGGKVTTIISIKNWEKYQKSGEQNRIDNKGESAVLGQVRENRKENRTENKRETNNNDSNNGNKKGDSYFFDLLPKELDTVEFKESWANWLRYQKEKKNTITQSTAKIQFGKLVKFRAQGMNPIEVINESIGNNWQGLFPLKQEKRKEQPEQITSKLKFIDPNQPGWM